MGAMFRSEEMALCQLFIQPEAAYTSVSELGEAGSVQFRDAHLEKTENEILELSHNAVNLKQNYLELTELRHVLEKTEAFFIAQEEIGMDSMTKSLISDETGQQAATRGRLGFVAGVVNRERVPAFERMLWRISRGNVFLRRAELDKPLEDPATGNEIYKTVFVAFFQGEQLKSRIKKVLNQTSDHRQRVLASVAKELASWTIMVRKMKAIYHTLNLFNMDVTKKCLIGECWVPTQDLPNVQKALADGSNACGSSIPSFLNCIETDEEPPTFNRTNRFTRALYTIITFPFLFAVMFGDLGHGCIMALFGAWMVCKEVSLAAKKSNNEIWNIFFAGRYIILLMGCFSMYTGLVYNDIFSKSMNIFGSSWSVPYDNETMENNAALTMDPKTAYNNNPYFIGIDPVWQSADNKIIFLNSYKMKLSIIFVLEFLPQVIFLCLLFLYMVFMMFYKWVAYSAFSEEQAYSPGCAPSVLILFINMMLFSSTEPADGCKEYMFDSQASIQRAFVLVALCCIPVMLLGKPLYLLAAGKKKKEAKPEHSNGSVNPGIEMQEQTDIGDGAPKPEAKAAASGHDHEDEPFSEIMIHQAIHTIEYVLSTISHTASYLRLWALSLAHAEREKSHHWSAIKECYST
ncbi:hypothetical protein HF086_009971 [Spodoptera exigua]|uniref:V-type proton ATPase subunit a n=1 Tax=Spodoptera exigua TaxID=7107 RepID=A0A922MFC5_SPOEX|nr:hypothetical protein HF086_009971 [Spodoptera exigua]